MGQRGSKHQNVKTMTASFSGGLNLHDSAINIQDNQLRDARNFYYADRGAALVTRPGIKPVLGAPMGAAQLTVFTYPIGVGGWRLSGETTWRDGGVSINTLLGNYTIEFETVDGFTPNSLNISVVRNCSYSGYYPVVQYIESVNDASQLWYASSPSVTIGASQIRFGPSPNFGGSDIAINSFKIDVPKYSVFKNFYLHITFIGWDNTKPYSIRAAKTEFDPKTGSAAQFKALYDSVSTYVEINDIQSYIYRTPDLSSLINPIVSDSNFNQNDYISLLIGGIQWSEYHSQYYNSIDLTYLEYYYGA